MVCLTKSVLVNGICLKKVLALDLQWIDKQKQISLEERTSWRNVLQRLIIVIFLAEKNWAIKGSNETLG